MLVTEKCYGASQVRGVDQVWIRCGACVEAKMLVIQKCRGASQIRGADQVWSRCEYSVELKMLVTAAQAR